MKPLLIFCALLLATQIVTAAGKAREAAPRLPTDLKIVDNIVFKQIGEKQLELMLFQPLVKKYEKAPLVVYIHGGGWGGGDRYKVLRQDVIGVIRSLSQAGFVCASVEYRLVDGKPTLAADAVADCKDALRFMVKHAQEYGIDTDRIGTFGSSAGGHLTLVTALGKDSDYPCDPAMEGPPAKVRCVAAFYPLVSFVDAECMKGGNFERPQRMIPLLGGLLTEKRELALKLSPIELLRADSPAVLVAHGDDDKVLSVHNAIALRDAAQAKGASVECIISKGAGHGFSGDAISPTIAEIDQQTTAFFLKHLADAKAP
ncbi:alpha/beta hydrolase fold domain-containing protein [Prosthecobacter sp.]|uniref:alpha/beta hydrolase fold domain-containing protein n=1 Tax=Prosthecobacter sp. TaxID=1965333 RepID=UPI003782EC86